ncbi:DnaJ-like protein subfamily C member 21 [Exophiala dermatitidis]
MGQGQSTNNAAAQEDVPAKSDYYDLLGVDRTASDDEIKKAYRRKALELHPDRNYGNVEHATRLFAEIQSAYEVLSDPQERAWYDSHRDVLLRGDQAAGPGTDEFSYNIRMTTTEDVLKLMMKFNGRLEYSNAPSGFFGGLNDFFKQLAQEEDIACQWEGQEPMDYPEFGFDNDDYEDVVRPFYAAWSGFATKKSYAWKDQYRLSDAPDRRIRRLMEKENKKLREDAIQEFNEAVRSLVAFVRKRDPRVQNNQKSEAERQKALREAAAAQAARSRAARQAKLQEYDTEAIPEWAKSRDRDEHEGGFTSESEVEEHEYDCVVCDKTFKSEAQFKAHEKSKKHLKLLKQLQKEMRHEGTELNLDSRDAEPDPQDASVEEQEADETQNGNRADDAHEVEDLSDHGSDYAEQHPPTNGTINARGSGEVSEDISDDDYAPRSDIEQRLVGETAELEQVTAGLEDTSLADTPATSDPEEASKPKVGKAKLKRAKKAAQKATGQSDRPIAEFTCAVCKAEFPSKTKLFNHIKEKDHAAPVAQIKGAKAGKGKKRR